MQNYISMQKCVLLLPLLLLIVQECYSFPKFSCLKTKGDPVPSLPPAFTTNIRVNYPNQYYSVDLRQVTHDKKDGKDREAVELWAGKRHVKYIDREDQGLVIDYKSSDNPKCSVKPFDASDFFEENDAGPSQILLTLSQTIQDEKQFFIVGPTYENGIFVMKWEACLDNPKINVSLSFTHTAWNNSHPSPDRGLIYPVMAEAQIDNVYLTAIYSNFNPKEPEFVEFEPPEGVYCEGIISSKQTPNISDYFSYNSEIIVHRNAEGKRAKVFYMTVYYDYPSNISRIDLFDAIGKDEVNPTSQRKSIIQDYNSGVQYTFDTISGKCSTGNFDVTYGILLTDGPPGDYKMPNANTIFKLNGADIHYNGEYLTRDLKADVFTGKATVYGSPVEGTSIITWYFSTDQTQLVENRHFEKNVPLRMMIRPEAGTGKKGQVEINFYNFVNEEPSFFMYDLTSCYNDSSSKTLILTLPASQSLNGEENFIKSQIAQSIQAAIGINKLRIFVREITFVGEKMYAEFTLLDIPPVMGKLLKENPDEITLDKAVAKLKELVAQGKFSVNVNTKEGTSDLKIEPNGLNELAGDQKSEAQSTGYKQGSVIALTVGILFLGFVLGGIAVNLIISKKYGVSLFQKSDYGNNQFDNPLNESEM